MSEKGFYTAQIKTGMSLLTTVMDQRSERRNRSDVDSAKARNSSVRIFIANREGWWLASRRSPVVYACLCGLGEMGQIVWDVPGRENRVHCVVNSPSKRLMISPWATESVCCREISFGHSNIYVIESNRITIICKKRKSGINV